MPLHLDPLARRPPTSNGIQPPRPRSAPPVTNDYYPMKKNTRCLGCLVMAIAVKHFTEGLLPWTDPSRTAQVYDVLKNSGSICRGSVTSLDQWNIGGIGPTSYGCAPSIDSASAMLKQVVDAISRAAGLSETLDALELVSSPEWAQRATVRKFRGGLAQVPALDCSQDLVVGEVWQNDGDGYTASELLADMHKIMRDDPARRCVYGFTLEDLHMRLWYVCRAGSFVSYSFGFATNPRYVISSFLPLLLATRAELGLDSTVRLVGALETDAEAVYDIGVGDKTYRTQRLLSAASGTRWWDVRELDGAGNEVGAALTLKDAWVETGWPTEAEILRDATSEMSEKEKACFMRVADESRVCIDGGLDETPVVVRCDGKVVDVRRGLADAALSRTVGSRDSFKIPFTLPELAIRAPDIKCSAKIHHRIVFDEVGKSIRELESLGQVFDCLADAVEGLRALHVRGWVHRNITEHAIGWINGRGKLLRVEHALKRVEERADVIKTSNPYLTPLELEHERYLWATSPTPPSPTISIPEDVPLAELRRRRPEFLARLREAQAAAARTPQPAPFHHPPFAPNALHDLEGVFWLALLTLLTAALRAPPGVPAAEWGCAMESRRDIAREVFGNGCARRYTFLSSERCLADVLRGLHPVLRPVGEALEGVRGALMVRYREVEEMYRGVGGGDTAAGLHVRFRACFYHVSWLLEQKDVAIDVDSRI